MVSEKVAGPGFLTHMDAWTSNAPVVRIKTAQVPWHLSPSLWSLQVVLRWQNPHKVAKAPRESIPRDTSGSCVGFSNLALEVTWCYVYCILFTKNHSCSRQGSTDFSSDEMGVKEFVIMFLKIPQDLIIKK